MPSEDAYRSASLHSLAVVISVPGKHISPFSFLTYGILPMQLDEILC